jgi:hypothetical protein
LPGKKTRKGSFHVPAGFQVGRLLADWVKKASGTLKKGVLDARVTALNDASIIDDLALLQISRAHQALTGNFGLPLGLASPEVIVLGLYPHNCLASLEAVEVACRELALVNAKYSPDEVASALDGKFWAMAEGRPVPLAEIMAVDLGRFFRKAVEFNEETRRIPDMPLSKTNADDPPLLVGMGAGGAPVLAVFGLFPGSRFKQEENVKSPGRRARSTPVPRTLPLKPFTRHDASMSIFSFVEKMLLACGQGLASVLAPFDLSHLPEAVGMRKRWVKEFDRVYVDAMADAALYQLLKLPPSRVSRSGRGAGAPVLYRRDDRPSRCVAMTAPPPKALNGDESYLPASPGSINRYSLIPPQIPKEYRSWASVIDIAKVEPISGLMEKRGGALIDSDCEALKHRMSAYLERHLFFHDYAELGLRLTGAHPRFTREEAYDYISRFGGYDHRRIKSYAFKPFDNRYCYYSPATLLWNDPRPELARLCRPDNRFVVTRPAGAVETEGVPFFLTAGLTDGDLLRGHAYCIPLCLYDENDYLRPHPNLSPAMLEYLRVLRRFETYKPEQQAQLVWRHVLAIGFSPAYRAANIEALRQDWPRIPFPAPVADNDQAVADASALLLDSAELGRRIAALLEPEVDSQALFGGENADSYSELAPLFSWSAGRKDAEPFACDSIDLNANWGYAKIRRMSGRQPIEADGHSRPEQAEGHASESGGNASTRRGRRVEAVLDDVKDQERESARNVMPGNGRLHRRGYSNKERRALEGLGLGMGLHAGAVYAALGHDACDIYLDRNVYWRNVPSNVWEYRIGGYQVLKKWLSYREHTILGRELRREEIGYFTEMVRRLTTLRLLESELDRNFAHVRDHGGDPTKRETRQE